MTEATKGDDLALGAARAAVWLFLLLVCAAIAALGALLVAAFVDGELLAEITGHTGAVSPRSAFALFATAIVAAIALLLVAVQFLRKLLAIVRTVRLGDPFIAANARRLRAMAWMLLAIQLGSLALDLYARWLERRELIELSIDGGNPMTGLFVVLVLFVLARVFAHGAAMRDELEGTV